MATPSSPELQAFLQHLAVQRRLAERTLAMYAEALVRLERLAAAAGVTLQRAEVHHLRGFVVQLRPAPDLQTQQLHEMRGAFLVRRGHPLARKRSAPGLQDLRRYPVASTPLSDEVARVLVERYGPEAHPEVLVTLRCDELPSLVDVARHSDTVLLAIQAAAPDLVALPVAPSLAATARFGLVTLRQRTEPPALAALRTLMQERLVDTPG